MIIAYPFTIMVIRLFCLFLLLLKIHKRNFTQENGQNEPDDLEREKPTTQQPAPKSAPHIRGKYSPLLNKLKGFRREMDIALKMCKYLHLQASFHSSINTDTMGVLSPSNLSSSGCSHVGSHFTNEEQKRLARDMFDTFATYSNLVHDITDTDRWAHKTAALMVVFPGLSNFDF